MSDPADPANRVDPAGPADPADPAEPSEPAHRSDGLDLARAAARAAARGPLGTPVVRRRRGSRPGTREENGDLREPTGTPSPADRSLRRRRGGLSGPGPDDRDPQALGAMVERMVRREGWAESLQTQGVFARWAEVVGAEVGAHSTPESLTDGRLVVRTDSTAWATQLRLLAPTLVRRLNEELGHGTVTVIDVQGPVGPSWKKGRRSVGGRGPRDTYG